LHAANLLFVTGDGNAAGDWPKGRPPAFDEPALLGHLESMPIARLDDLDFGLIVMDRAGDVIGYNTFESQRAGIRRERVMGRNFFVDVGPCTNNYLVAERFHEESELDEQLDYVFTFRMSPTPVRLRLLAATDSPRQYLAVRNR
jgi:photoactive yellow protein